MATQYTLNLGLASHLTNAEAQKIVNILNPSIGTLSPKALKQLEQQLMAIGSQGNININKIQLDKASTPCHPLFDVAITAGENETLKAGAGHDTIVGTSGDVLYGSTSASGGADLIATTGDETLIGGAGHDTLHAGSGHDTLIGGTGNQTLVGSTSSGGTASIVSGSGNDLLQAGAGHDTLKGGGGYDTLIGGSGSSTLISGSASNGHQLLQAGSGTSILYAGSGKDTLYGGSGNSTLYAGSNNDTMYGGIGNASHTTFVVSAATFKNDVIIGRGGSSVLDLSDLSRNQVTIKTSHGVTTVVYGSHTLTLKDVNAIQFKDGSSINLPVSHDTDHHNHNHNHNQHHLHGDAIGHSTLHAGSGHDTIYGGYGGHGHSGFNGTFAATSSMSAAPVNNITGSSGANVLSVSEFTQNQVSIKTAQGITSVAFGSHNSPPPMNPIDFKDGGTKL